jgi:uncharacterized membrane protein YvlD (DUF360 family)
MASSLAYGMIFENGVSTLFMAGAGMTVASFLVKPVINMLLLPLNLITFNLFRWVSSAITLYLVTLMIDGFKIVEFRLISIPGYALPQVELSGWLSYVAFSFVIAFISGIIYWLVNQN